LAEQWQTIRTVDTNFETGQTSDETVITLETAPAVMPVGWVNFLKQRFHVLGIDYEHVVFSFDEAARHSSELEVSSIEPSRPSPACAR
jgi:hypothetical protein